MHIWLTELKQAKVRPQISVICQYAERCKSSVFCTQRCKISNRCKNMSEDRRNRKAEDTSKPLSRMNTFKHEALFRMPQSFHLLTELVNFVVRESLGLQTNRCSTNAAASSNYSLSCGYSCFLVLQPVSYVAMMGFRNVLSPKHLFPFSLGNWLLVPFFFWALEVQLAFTHRQHWWFFFSRALLH